MDMPGCKPPIRPRVLGFRGLLMAACLAASGCLGPTAVRSTRMRYNEVVRTTNDEQLLMNLVRLRYADSPIFIDLPSITSQFELAGGTSYPGPDGASTEFGIVGLTGRDTPTLSYHPRHGREVAKALLNPLAPDLFSVVNAGARLDQFFWMTLNDINDVPNAARATTLIPKVPDENSQFRRGIELLEALDDQGGVEIGFTTSEDEAPTSGPISEAQVQGDDLLGAAKDGYAFRTNQSGRLALYKREKELTLKVRSRFTHSPEMEELAQIFHLTAGLSHYKIKSELQPNAKTSPLGAFGAGDTIYLNLRSCLQIMTFLSKGVCVPEEHVLDGVAPMTPGPDGRPFNWTQVTAGNFFVASQKHRPKHAEVAVHYRDYWFYIPQNDVNSRSILAVMEIILSLQESDEKSAGPVLTLPVGG